MTCWSFVVDGLNVEDGIDKTPSIGVYGRIIAISRTAANEAAL